MEMKGLKNCRGSAGNHSLTPTQPNLNSVATFASNLFFKGKNQLIGFKYGGLKSGQAV
jgi:hypothetical protein